MSNVIQEFQTASEKVISDFSTVVENIKHNLFNDVDKQMKKVKYHINDLIDTSNKNAKRLKNRKRK
jgi:gas vesicle protein